MRAYCAPAMRVAVLTTSYPRDEGTSRAPSSATPSSTCARRGSRSRSSRPPASGTSASRTATASSANLDPTRRERRSLPAFLASYAQAARRRAAKGADLVHAHWLPSGFAGARDGAAVRAPGVGHRRRAGGPRAGALPAGHSPGPRRGRAVDGGCGRADATRRDRRPRDRQRRRPTRLARRARRAAARPLRRPAVRGERHRGAGAGDGGRPARGRRRRAAARRSFPTRSASCRRRSSATTTTGPPSSSARPGVRGTASSPARRWRTAGRSSHRLSAGCSTPSSTSGRACWCRPATPERCEPRSSACLPDPTLRARLGAAARERAGERFSWAAATSATLEVYEAALSPGRDRPARRAASRAASTGSTPALDGRYRRRAPERRLASRRRRRARRCRPRRRRGDRGRRRRTNS